MQAAIKVLEREVEAAIKTLVAAGTDYEKRTGFIDAVEWAINKLKAEPIAQPSYQEEAGIIPEQEWEKRAEDAERGCVKSAKVVTEPYVAPPEQHVNVREWNSDIATAKQRHHDAEEMKREAQAYQDGHPKPGDPSYREWFMNGYEARSGAASATSSEPILDMTSQARAKRPWPLKDGGANDWHDHDGKVNISAVQKLDLKLRNGEVMTKFSNECDWDHNYGPHDIVAYRKAIL